MNMEDKRYSVRDAVPETPDTFYDAVERSLSACGPEKSERSARHWGGLRLPRRLLIPMVTAAVLLIATTAVAAGVLLRDHYDPANYLAGTRTEREEQGKTIPDVEEVIASAQPENGDYTITMQPDLPEAELLAGNRLAMGQPAYSEADWGWMRDIKPEIQEVLYDGRTCTFTVRLNTDHGPSFNWPREDSGQWVEALVDEARFRMVGEEAVHDLLVSGGIQSFDETGATLWSEVNKEAPFPSEGRVELTIDVGLRDAKVEDMNPIGDVAVLRYTFTFDVAAAKEAATPAVTLRPLSGTAVLTVDDWSDPDQPKLYNQRVSLDGVVLREETVYRPTGVYVTYTVDSAPAGWKDAYTTALLYSNREGRWFGLYIDYRLGQEGEWLAAGHESHGNFGEQTVVLPIFPSDYETAKAQGVTLRLTEYYGTDFNGQPIGEDWHMDIPAGAMTLDFELAPQELGTFEVPLP